MEPVVGLGHVTPCYNHEFVLDFMVSILSALRFFFRSRCDTALEFLALRQQVAVLQRKRPRPTLNSMDRLFWTLLHRCWSRCADVLVLVNPETVVGWHRRVSGSTGVGDPARGAVAPARLAPGRRRGMRCRERLGGLLRYYSRAA